MREFYVASILLLAGCATTSPPAERIVTHDVLISVRAPCPAEADIPAKPKTVHEENPSMPANAVPTPKDLADAAAWISYLRGEVDASHKRERILAGKVLEDRNYIEPADRIMRRCAKPPAPSDPPH
jgi:hypothetical protein